MIDSNDLKKIFYFFDIWIYNYSNERKRNY